MAEFSGDVRTAAASPSLTLEMAARYTVQAASGGIAWLTLGLFAFILTGLAGVAALTLAGLLPYWLAVPVNAVLIYLIFTPLHEAVHGNICGRHRRWRWAERVVGHISGFVLLAPYPGFAALHAVHHQHTNDPDADPDYWVKGTNLFNVVLRCLAIQAAYLHRLWILADDKEGKRVFAAEMVYFVLVLGIIAASYWAGIGNEVMLLWILPGYLGLVMCPFLFDWVVHHPHGSRERYTNTSVLIFPGPLRLIADLMFCGQTYHLMHHLYPRVPFYAYRSVYKAVRHTLADVGAPVRTLS